MFLHSGIGSHSHEYSPLDRLTNTNTRRSQLARSAFSTSITRRSSAYESPLPNIPPVSRRNSEYIPSTQPVVRFQEPENMSENEDGRSIASEGSATTAGGSNRRRRTIRTSSTTFHLAHPAPTVSQKQKLLLIRPKLLLQLQRLSPLSRPKPVIDVLPSTVVVPRLAKKFPRIFRGKSELGANDVMIVKSEEYDTVSEEHLDDSDSDEEGLGRRDLMAVICQMPNRVGGAQGKAEIAMSDGSVWTATPQPGGQYEFSTIDERGHTTTARWVRRRENRRRSVDTPDQIGINLTRDVRFTFSMIDPNSRRHPILGTLTATNLEIPDHYTTVSSSAGKYPPTSPIRGLPGDSDYMSVSEELASERTTHTIDDITKIFIQVTGIWVALRENWSPYFKYNDSACIATSGNATTSGRVRSLSLTPPSAALVNTGTPDSSHSALIALSNKMKRGSVKVSPASGHSLQQESAIIPKRSVSTGAAFMQRATARKLSHPSTIVPGESDGEESFGSPRRAATETLNGSLSNRMSTPISGLTLGGSAASSPETPTRPQRRHQSMYVPTSTLQNGYLNRESDASGDSTLVDNTAVFPEEKQKLSRWKAFTNMFRRASSTQSA